MLSLIFLLTVSSQSDPVARFETFMKGAKSVSADLEFTMSGEPAIGKGILLYKKPNLALFTMKWLTSDFSFSVGPKDTIAIERGAQLYREYATVGEIFLPDTDISEAPRHSFPLPLIAGTLRVLLPQSLKFNRAGTKEQGGVLADVLHAQYKTQMGDVKVTVLVDAVGRAVEIKKEFLRESGEPVSTVIRINNYRINQPIPEASFTTPVPAGFTAQTLVPDPFPLNVGEKFPVTHWKKTGGGADLATLSKGKALFVAIGDPECEISKAAAKTVGEIAKGVAEKGGVSVELSERKGAPVFTGLPYFFDATGKQFEMLGTPGTPIFFLVSPKGLITRVWYGFNPAEAEAFKKDLMAWVGKPPTPQ